MADAWLSFDYAAEEVERRLGLTWGKAQKTVMDWCETDAVKSRQSFAGGPDVSRNDLEHQLELKLKPKRGFKQARIMEQLAKMFPESRVPDPADCSRKSLRADLLRVDPKLDPLDESTLKTAIDKYNGTIRMNPNKIVSD